MHNSVVYTQKCRRKKKDKNKERQENGKEKRLIRVAVGIVFNLTLTFTANLATACSFTSIILPPIQPQRPLHSLVEQLVKPSDVRHVERVTRHEAWIIVKLGQVPVVEFIA